MYRPPFLFVMATGQQILERVRSIDVQAMSGAIIDRNGTAVADLNRKQLHKGISTDGKQLSPKYSEDPWFKTREAAARYAAWKKSIFPEMEFDVPNLIITGVFHKSISVKASNKTVTYNASASFANGIQSKYQGKALGLTIESKATVWTDIVKPDLLSQTRDKTGFK